MDEELSGSDKQKFEEELAPGMMKEKKDAVRLGELLRSQPSPPLANGDFFNSQVLQSIRLLDRSPAFSGRRSSWLPRFAWAGALCMASAAIMFHFMIPTGPQASAEVRGGYMAQFYGARATVPTVSASAFHSKKDNVSVLWLDGLDYLPETADLK